MNEVCTPRTFPDEHDGRLFCRRKRTTYAKLADKGQQQTQKEKQPKIEKSKVVEETKEAPKKGKKKK